jgi:hypothetical protein
MSRPARSVDLNQVWMTLTLGIAAGTWWFYSVNRLPRLVNDVTLQLFALLVVQVVAMLLYERRYRSPLLLTLTFVLIFFHLPRIVTLYWVPDRPPSAALDRLRPVWVEHINETLWFILLANCAIWVGIAVARHVTFVASDPARRDEAASTPAPAHVGIAGRRVFWFLAATFAYGIYTAVIVPINTSVELRGLRYLGILLNPIIALVVSLAYVHQARTQHRQKGESVTGIVVLCVLLAIAQTAFGSRSAILTQVQTLLFLALAMGLSRVPRRAVTVSAVLLMLSVPLFTVATLARSIRTEMVADASLREMTGRLADAVVRGFSGDVLPILRPVFDRTAFLDFSVDLVKNRVDYAQVINLPFYAKSMVDSLTPGFDLFDTPRASNALSLVYRYQLHQMQRQAEAYQSDQFNVYGEYYVLFGPAFGLVALALSAWGFQWWLQRVRSSDLTATNVWRYFVVVAFFNWVISFGLDWQVITGAREAAVIAILLPLLRTRVPVVSAAVGTT